MSEEYRDYYEEAKKKSQLMSHCLICKAPTPVNASLVDNGPQICEDCKHAVVSIKKFINYGKRIQLSRID